jgi:hypothetical protein
VNDMAEQDKATHDGWSKIIELFQEEYRLFALVLLVVAGLDVLAIAITGADRSFLVRAIVAMILVVLTVGAILAVRNFSVRNARSKADDDARKREDLIQELKNDNEELKARRLRLETENKLLELRIKSLVNLENQIYTVVASLISASVDTILVHVNATRKDVQSLITVLIRKGEIVTDSGGSFRIRQKSS